MLEEYFEDRGAANPKREAIAFMRAHAGCCIVIPVLSTVERMAVDEAVVKSMDKDPRRGNATRLANLFGVPDINIGKIVKRKTGVGVESRRSAMLCRHPRISRYRLRVEI